MKYKMIACDLDGTLLLHGAQDLNPETCGLISKLLDQGMTFTAATGRQYANVQRLFQPIRNRINYVCENGCLAFFQGKMIYRSTMDRTLGEEMIQDILGHAGCEVLVSGVDTSYIQPKQESFYDHMKNVVKNNVTVMENVLSVTEPFFKISIYHPDGMDSRKEYFEKRYGGRATVVTSGSEWMDMMPIGVNKGLGLAKLLKKTNVSPEECIGIGDNINDIEMLKLVGCPVAMDSGKDEVKEISRFQIRQVEDLLKQLIDS